MHLRILILLLLAAALLPVSVIAGTSGKIAGMIADEKTGDAIPGASVKIDGTSMGAATNLDGYYVILNIPPGQYSLTISAVGYTKKTVRDVVVQVDLTTTVDQRLSQEVVELGEEVVVTAERRALRKDLTSSEARVDAAQIDKLAVREVADVLALQAGVTTDRNGAIHIRGGRSNEVGYWVDGISVSDVYDGSQAVQVDNNAIQELQVISGTFNAEYGQAMSGIVNIVTKDGGAELHGNLSTYVGSYLSNDKTFFNLQQLRPLDTRDIEASLNGPLGVPGLTFYFSGRYLKSNGWLYGNHVFNPDGSLAPGADTIFNDAHQMTGIHTPDSPVSMNGRERYSGQFKLTYQISGDVKFALTGVGSRIDYRDFNHDYMWNPDGDVNKHDRGYNVSGLFTHALGARSFYTLNLAYINKSYREYLYQDPFDPRYNLNPFAFNRGLYEFLHGATNLHHFTRRTETREAKFDFTSQVSQLHELKVGADVSIHRLYLEDYNIIPVQDSMRVDGVLTGFYRAAIPDITGPLYDDYTQKPIQFSAYVQDKLEYERMIVNIGVRFDYFNSRGQILADPQDPNVYLPQKQENIALSLSERLASWYKKASAKTSLSPRFGISYPITDRGILHFSYGHFLKIPSFEFLYQNPGYKINSVDPLQGVFGNADLKPERTIMYEFGLQQQVSDVLVFDVTGFYRDTRDWVSTSAKIPVRDPESATIYYTQFINKDYANSRGITLTVNKRLSNLWSLNFAYTFEIAEGINSTPDEEQAAYQNNSEPTLTLSPLAWDQAHTANLSVGLGQADWGGFLVGRFSSGLPYTPVINQAEARGEDAARIVTKNSRRQPSQITLDFRAYKDITIAPLKLSVFLQVFNLLDTRNEQTVYGQTGRAFATAAQMGVAGLSNSINRINTVEDFLVRPDYYTEPRQIQFGVDLNF